MISLCSKFFGYIRAKQRKMAALVFLIGVEYPDRTLALKIPGKAQDVIDGLIQSQLVLHICKGIFN